MMKFAFSTASCPSWDLPTILARAREWGYDGVELHAPPNDTASAGPTPVAPHGYPADVRAAFAAAGVEVACLSGAEGWTGRRKDDARRAATVRAYIDAAAALGCLRVRVPDPPVRRGQSASTLAVAMGDWLLALGDYAAGRGVTVLVDNTAAFRKAGDMWVLLDRLQHPNLACCWGAAAAGEPPQVSVPVLNTRIQYARWTGPATAGGSDSGGGATAEHFVVRLRGVGYGGYVGIAAGESELPDVVKAFKAWAAHRASQNKGSDASPAGGPAKKGARAVIT